MDFKKLAVRTGIAIGVVAPSAAFAGPTTLTFMPVADILSHREFMYSLNATGYERNISRGYTWDHYLEIGLYNRVEAGVDSDLLGNTTYNAKLKLLDKPAGAVSALSVGVWNYNQHGKGDYYAIARHDGKGYRLHVGFNRNLSGGAGLFGVDAPLAGGTAMAEWQSGLNSRGWVGYSSQIRALKGVTLQGSAGIPGVRENGYQYFMAFYYDFRL